MISNLKLKWDVPRGKTIHNSASVLVGFIWSLSVIRWLLSLPLAHVWQLWNDKLSSSTMFSKEYKDFLESLSSNMHDQTFM